jgi:uncharacterized protein (TIGR03083 family)
MTLPRVQVENGLLEELYNLAGLVEPLTTEELATETRCVGWTVSDVTGHVCGTLSRIARGDVGDVASPEVTAAEAGARRGRSGAELADELRASAASSWVPSGASTNACGPGRGRRAWPRP